MGFAPAGRIVASSAAYVAKASATPFACARLAKSSSARRMAARADCGSTAGGAEAQRREKRAAVRAKRRRRMRDEGIGSPFRGGRPQGPPLHLSTENDA